MLGRNEQIVFQQETREQQPMPLVVGKLLDQTLDLVSASAVLTLSFAELSGLSAEFASQVALCVIHVPVGIRLMYSECLKCLPDASFRYFSGLLDCVFKLPAEIGWKSAHRITGPDLSFSSTCLRTLSSHLVSSVVLWSVAPVSTKR